MSERKRAVLYFLAFVVYVLVLASPFAESAERMAEPLVYVGLALLIIVSAMELYWWWQRQTDPERAIQQQSQSPWMKRIAALMKSQWPF